MDESELRQRELELHAAEIAVRRDQEFIRFAQYGFGGTLAAAVASILLILGLAALSAFTSFRLTWEFIVLIGIILIGLISFGFFSLWQLPTIVGRYQDASLGIGQTGTLPDMQRRDRSSRSR